MSYTMTVDMPERAKAYIRRQGPRFSEELNAIVLAVVQAKMQYEDLPTSDADEEDTPYEMNRAEGIVDSLSGIIRLPADFDDGNIHARAALEKYESLS